MGTQYNTIKDYLTEVSKADEGWIPGFVLTHGRLFGKILPLPKGEKRGSKQICFWNAYVLTMNHPELIYAEGFFRKSLRDEDLIRHHAWAVDKKGNVYDPTWRGQEYFGIPFKPEYVLKTMHRILPECQSLLDNNVEDYPLMRGIDSGEWLYEMDF